MRGYALALLVVAAISPAEDRQWQRIADREGIVIERPTAQDASIREVRATTHSPLPPAAIMATVWKHDEYVQFVPYLKRLDVLRDEGDAKLIYEQVRVPLAKDRDATIRITRTFSPDTGTYEITSSAVADEGPPERDDYVRVRTSVARWRLAPAADGGTALTYTIRTDAGGMLAGWIVDTMQKNAVPKILRAMLDRARQRTP
jgi:ribosome-associated toxin RatA of RatAB toxin-antitoxin module